jgi:mycobactin peptide synthetase MbtE
MSSPAGPTEVAGSTEQVTIHAVVQRFAAWQPDKVALVDQGDTVTYRMLDIASDAYAHALRSTGVGRGSLIPVLLPRSAELVVVILGLLKAGAAYALLDERWPAARHQEILAQLGAELVISSPERADSLQVEVWTPKYRTVDHVEAFESTVVDTRDPCCAFFTSGTTGRPKIVVSPHCGTVRLFHPCSFARFDERTVMPLAAALPWDGFAFELWSVLLNGGTSVIVREPYLTPQMLRHDVREYGVNTVFLSTSLLHMFIDEDLDAFDGIDQIVTGGERLSTRHVQQFLQRYPATVLVNGYGPVESTCVATTHRVSLADGDLPHGIPIGRPVSRTEVYVLDGERPCAVGEPGELCIAGDGLALGYLDMADLTAEKFPVLDLDGRGIRVYRTGDLAQRDADGLLHYLGRIDRQLKIRGHRVEPAEVERQIEGLLAVKRCVVVARRDDDGRCVGMAAFCIPERTGDTLEGALDVLRKVMVYYHVPDVVRGVEDFPLTRNGKLDEASLLGLLRDETQSEPADVLPDADPLVALVAGTFAAVLGRLYVPSQTRFEELGGSSLDAFRVCARLTTELNRPVSVQQLLEQPSAREFASWLRNHAADVPQVDAITSTDSRGVPLTPIQADFLEHHLSAPDDLSSHFSGMWLIDGPLDLDRLEQAITDTHHRQEALRAEYRDVDIPIARVTDVAVPRPVLLHQAADADAAIADLRAELSKPLHITAGEIWRVALAPLVDGGAMLAYVVHHIAFDGWSQGVLAADLSDAYRADPAEVRPPAPTLAEMWTTRQRHRAQVDIAAQLARRVEDLRGTPTLAFPGVPTAVWAAGPSRIERFVGCLSNDAVTRRASELRQTRFAVLLAAYARAMADCTGQNDFGITVPMAQRLDQSFERAIGCLVDMAAIRVHGAATATGATTGPLIRAALAAQHVEFPKLIRALDPDRSAGPVFRTSFVYQEHKPPRLALPDARTRFVRPPYLGIRNDIHTEVWPQEDGRLLLALSYRPNAVSDGFAESLADCFAEQLRLNWRC